MVAAKFGRRIHVRFRQVGSLIAAVACLTLVAPELALGANTYYIAPTGSSDSNVGSIGAPFATIGKAVGVAAPGDTIYMRGGTYNLASRVQISKAGTSANLLHLFAYPGEIPVLDFSAQSLDGSNRGLQFENASQLVARQRTYRAKRRRQRRARVGARTASFEQIITRRNRDSGFQLHGIGRRTISSSTATRTKTSIPRGRRGRRRLRRQVSPVSDPAMSSAANRSWANSDDGWDTWESRERQC